MGAGNPLARSYDPELYKPNTYFIDFCANLVSEKDYDKDEELLDNFATYDTYCDAEIDCQMEMFCSNLHDNPDLDSLNMIHQSDWIADSDLTAKFRGNALIMGESDNLLLIHVGGEYHHFSIACVPSFRFEDLHEDTFTKLGEESDTMDTDEWESHVEKQALKKYNERLKIFHKEKNKIMRAIYNDYSFCFSMRKGAWTSIKMPQIGDDYEF